MAGAGFESVHRMGCNRRDEQMGQDRRCQGRGRVGDKPQGRFAGLSLVKRDSPVALAGAETV